MKRLLSKNGRENKNTKRIITASYFTILHSFISRTGYPIEFLARIVSGKLMYSIVMYYEYESSSFYDGTSFEDAFDFYVEILSALKNITEAEKVKRYKKEFLSRASNLLLEAANYKVIERRHLYHKKPLFLGENDPC